MFGHADWSDARAAAAVWNAKRFVQIEMANIGAVIARPAKTALRVHIRAVHVNLTAVFVHDLANFANGRFENAVRARVSHHQCGQIARVRVRLSAQISQIDIAIFQRRDGDDVQSGHDRARWICSVRGGRNQTSVAMRFAAGGMIFADREQTRVLAL